MNAQKHPRKPVPFKKLPDITEMFDEEQKDYDVEQERILQELVDEHTEGINW